jgi:acyl carrier protein
MNREQIQAELLAAIGEIAPETDLASIDAGRPLRQQIDLDSADWLNFLVAVHDKLGVDIPDAEAARLRTLQQLVDYCASRTGSPRS